MKNTVRSVYHSDEAAVSDAYRKTSDEAHTQSDAAAGGSMRRHDVPGELSTLLTAAPQFTLASEGN